MALKPIQPTNHFMTTDAFLPLWSVTFKIRFYKMWSSLATLDGHFRQKQPWNCRYWLIHDFQTWNTDSLVGAPGLSHYQTANFRLFQTERVCRQQFQIWRKWKKVIQIDIKHCGKRRNCSLRAISPFPTVFSKGLFPRGIKRCHCGNGLKLY